MLRPRSVLGLTALLCASPALAGALGYYRTPTVSGSTLVFAAEGDLWRVAIGGGLAQRLTTHLGEEMLPRISPDGATLAYTASYEGPAEVYAMPLDGGAPTRLTYEGLQAGVASFTPDGKVLYGTRGFTGTLDEQLATVDPKTGAVAVVPLAQAHDGTYDDAGRLFFTRLPKQPSFTKRYRGGTAQSIWSWKSGDAEARNLTADFTGTSRAPMWWNGRVYFASDRDGTMNLWSIDAGGRDPRQHTSHKGWDVLSPSLGSGRIAYQLGADIRVYDIAAGEDRRVDIRLASDVDQTRERWVKAPMDYLTASHPSPTGDRVALTAYGKVFVVPVGPGRLAATGSATGVRYRDARFWPDGSKLLALSTETGETEFVSLPANGVGASEQLSRDGKVIRWEGRPSPDGRYVAHHDKDHELWLLDVAARTSVRIDASPVDDFGELAWSPDSQSLVYGKIASNQFRQLFLYEVKAKRATALTTDRYDSYAPAFSPDGRLLYFLSDRVFESLVAGPWGPRQPEPFFDRMTKVYLIPLDGKTRSPFAQPDELHPKKDEAKDEKEKEKGKKEAKEKPDAPPVEVDVRGIAARLQEVPVPSGNYAALAATAERLFLLEEASGPSPKTALRSFKIDPLSHDVTTFLDDVKRFELSADRKKMLVAKGDDLYVVEAKDKPPDDLAKAKLDLSRWTFPVRPREEWAQMFDEAWRLERDYFYDRAMHKVDWVGMKEKYRPLLARVTTRPELSDLFGQMIGELSALHMYVSAGDVRKDPQTIDGATLGARLVRDPAAGGERVEHVYRSDPDQPDQLSPLARPGVGVVAGDVIEAIDGVPVLSVPGSAALLRNKAGRQTLLRVKPADGPPRDVVAVPLTLDQDADLRYDEWEYTRRLRVEERGKGKIGYVHLRAMNRTNVTEWYREFYPVARRQGLIVDVRYNRGGNIDSWILEKLIRPAWMYWQPRVGEPYWNMQHAFRGHAATLINYRTASDGEAFAEGFRRLKLGPVIGTRTWGGEIWLTSSNVLVDKGVATAAEIGVYGPEGDWLIEGHGVEPDVVVDNLPRATFEGEDRQLDAAIDALLAKISAEPREIPPPPPYPDKSK